MSGIEVSTERAKKALDNAVQIKIPHHAREVVKDRWIGPAGSKELVKDVSAFYWEEVGEVRETKFEEIGPQHQWYEKVVGLVHRCNVGIQISKNEMHGNTNPGIYFWNNRARGLYENPLKESEEKMKEYQKMKGHEKEYFIYKAWESERTLKLMAQLLIATGNEKLLVNQKYFTSFTDDIKKVLAAGVLHGIEVTTEIQMIPNSKTGELEHSIAGIALLK